MPTLLILVFTLVIMVTVIPYAFSSVIKQLQGVWALEEQCKASSHDYKNLILQYQWQQKQLYRLLMKQLG